MCQSADCQLFTANGGDKENFDVNNNGGGPALLPSTNCHCMLNRRTRRRHPATVQTPGRLEVGEVILEPLVSNRLEGSLDEMCGVDWTPSLSCSQNWTPSNTNNSYFSNNSYQPLKPYRFDVVEENLGRSSGGGGKENTNLGGYNSNGSSTTNGGQNNGSGSNGWKYTYMSS